LLTLRRLGVDVLLHDDLHEKGLLIEISKDRAK